MSTTRFFSNRIPSLRTIGALAAIAIFSLVLGSCVLTSYVSEAPTQPAKPFKGYGTLADFPFKEAWYGMYFQEDKVGYSHFKIEESGLNFKIAGDSVMRLKALKKTNEVQMKEKVIARPDLTLVSFESRVRMNGKDLTMTGRVEGDAFVLDMKVEGEKMSRQFPLEGRKLYHNSAISLFPALNGISNGTNYSFVVFNPEKQGLQEVKQEIHRVTGKPGPNDAVWKVNNHYGQSTVDSWLNRQGLTVLEKAVGGSLITMLEDKETAQKFLEGRDPKKDLVFDLSLIRVTKPIPNPEKVRFLEVRMKGVAPSLIPDDHRQKKTVSRDQSSKEGFEIEVHAEDLKARDRALGNPSGSYSRDELASTMAIQSDHKEIIAQAQRIVSSRDSALRKVRKLNRWTSRNIKDTIKDSFTALSVLRSREGECQSHANLYTALARSRKIPTRVVTGLVYTEDAGFLYHAWAESYVNGWIAVDPTLDQVPADATHIKIVSGKLADNMGALLKMVGKVKMEVLKFR